jgi:pimeloyl-ACP methyl ester carboxylesterase
MTTYPPLDVLKLFGNGIWVVDSGPLHAGGVLPLPVRMTVMQLEDGGIILHSTTRHDRALQIDSCGATSNFEALVRDLTSMPAQAGPAAETVALIAIGRGLQDRLCFPRQALRAQRAFPGSILHWFDKCGHFPMWDQPLATASFILNSLGNMQKGQNNEREPRLQQRV